MPLPSDTSLSLLGYSRPGDTLQSKPKQAMLVRLSSETLDALESFSSHPQVQFNFGANPGLYVGEEHFPMRHSQENTIHELFLRASSASKKSAPLKLHANVIGKFAVERELADELRDKIRESTQDAANQRNSRTTVFIDNPPDLQTNTTRKRKEPPSNMFRKPIRPSDKLKAPSVKSLQFNTNKSPASSQPLKDGSNAARKLIIQYLSSNNEATEERMFRIANSSDRNPMSNRQLLELLDQIAEPTSTVGKTGSSDSSTKTYRLKPVAWKEVRPFEWSTFSEQEQTRIARQARVVFQGLKIPETDPVWGQVRYKNTSSTGFPNAHSSSSADSNRGPSSLVSEEKGLSKTSDAIKRGLSSRETREKKIKPRPDTKGEIMMKDESRGATAMHRQTSNEKPNNVSDSRRALDTSVSDVNPGRAQGFHASKHTKASTIQADKDQAFSKTKVVQARQLDKSTSSSSSRVNLPSVQEERTLSLSQKSKKAWRGEEPPAIEPETAKRALQSENPKSSGARDTVKAPSAKRKVGDKVGDDDLYDPHTPSSSYKRPKSDHRDSPSLSSRKEELVRDTPPAKRENSEPEKPAQRKPQGPSSSVKSRKKNESPPPPHHIKRQTISSSREHERVLSESLSSSRSNVSHTTGSQSGKATIPMKPRRRSPIYTSSSEEDDPPLSARISADGLTSAANTKGPSHLRNGSGTRTLPTDHTALRARYSTSYLEYISHFHRLVIEKGKIDAMLKNNNLINTGGTSTDSDGDADLMDPDELAKLTMSHKKLQDELETIQNIFGATSNGDSATDLL